MHKFIAVKIDSHFLSFESKGFFEIHVMKMAMEVIARASKI